MIIMLPSGNININGTIFSPEQLERFIQHLEDRIEAYEDCARVLVALLDNGSIVDACVPEVLAAAAAAQKVGQL